MAYIGKRPEDALRGNATYNAFTGDGSTTTFDVTNLLPDGGAFDVEVFVDNVRQEAGASKSYTIGQDGSGDLKRITFVSAPDDGSEIYVINPGRETSLITVGDNTISAAKIQSDAVITAKILDSNVTTAKIADLNVTTAKIAADAITGAKLADDAVNSEHLTDGSVDNIHLAGSITNAKLANSSITINGTSINLGASGDIVAGTDWQAVTVADGSTQLTAVAGRGYFLDTNAGVIEVKLPASPSRGDTFVFADYGNNFGTNRVVIDTQGKLIDSTQGGVPDSDFVLETNGQVVELVFVDDTSGYLIKQNSTPSDLGADAYQANIEATGGTVTTSGDFKIHTFTGDANFVVGFAGLGTSDAPSVVDYLVVGGGGGGAGSSGSGAGAGGFRMSNSTSMSSPQTSPLANPSGITVTAQTYPITVGAGASGQSSPVTAPNGSNSIFSTITSAGGGGSVGQGTNGRPGGSGGGGGGENPGSTTPGGTGNTPPVSPAQGTNGGTGGQAPSNRGAGGGGGAGAAGQNAGTAGGDGGVGSFAVGTGFAGCNGTPGPVSGARYFAGGGGGGFEANSGHNGEPGTGGGGGAGPEPGGTPGNGRNATANTGGGAGGGSRGSPGSNSCQAGGNGGKGIVILRYKFQ